MVRPDSSSSRGGDVNRREAEAGESDASQSSLPTSSSSPSSQPPPSQHRPRSPTPSPPPACTACAGVTIYSRAHHDAGKPPSCLGVSRRRRQSSDLEGTEPTLLPPDVAPGGDFKFLCVGYAVCRENANKKREEESKRGGAGAGAGNSGRSNNLNNDDDDNVELPACLGVQIIRAAAATPAAMPMRGAGMVSASGNTSEKQQQQKSQQPQPQQQPRRAPIARNSTTPPPSASPELPSLLDALDKWEKSARRVTMLMGSNLVSIFGGRE